jgi:hypothetical protein
MLEKIAKARLFVLASILQIVLGFGSLSVILILMEEHPYFFNLFVYFFLIYVTGVAVLVIVVYGQQSVAL